MYHAITNATSIPFSGGCLQLTRAIAGSLLGCLLVLRGTKQHLPEFRFALRRGFLTKYRHLMKQPDEAEHRGGLGLTSAV